MNNFEKLDRECWSLDNTMAELLFPKVLYFKITSIDYGYPQGFLDYEDWEEVLDEICWALRFVAEDYPSEATKYIDKVDFERVGESSGFIETNIRVTYTNEEAHKEAVFQDKINYARCKNGLVLFGRYFTNLWV